MELQTSLSARERAAVEAVARAAADADGVEPLNEEARLQWSGNRALHWLAREGDAIVGYAQWQPENETGQIVVHPGHRRHGVGTLLHEAMVADVDSAAVWAFGDRHSAQRFATTRNLTPARSLHRMERPLSAADAVAPLPPSGVSLRPFTDADTDAFLAVNAAAFAGHPEQGHFDAADLAGRQGEAWWDPEGLILAEDATGLVGFHWTKRHDAATGEVYVLGVHPRAAGRGLGRLLLAAGLAFLAAGGAQVVLLYVDAGNQAAVALYEKAGFTITHTDTLYRPAAG